MKKTKIFISGKITGDMISDCIEKFKLEYLKIIWHFDEVISPLDIKGIHFGISHEKAKEICLNELKTCTHIYMLKDWKESKGAQMGHKFALENNIKIIYQK